MEKCALRKDSDSKKEKEKLNYFEDITIKLNKNCFR